MREEDIDEMHNLDVKQIQKTNSFSSNEYRKSFEANIFDASSAGRQQTGAATLSPPSMRNSGSRLPKKQKGSHFDMPSKSESNPSVSPYPPVRYEWEEWD